MSYKDIRKNTVFVSKEQFEQILKDPMFIAFSPAPSNKNTAGYFSKSNTWFQVKK